jgi:DNA-binding NtrC family response regulator
MPLLAGPDRAFAQAIAALVYANPFLPERIDGERAALGPEFVATGTLWHARADLDENPNLVRLSQRVEALADALRGRLAAGARAAPDELGLYEDLVLYLLFNRYQEQFYQLIEERGAATRRVDAYEAFVRDLDGFLAVPDGAFPAHREPAHLFACFFQVRRAFHHIFRNIRGGSLPAGRLRATVWQSIFTRDMRRYRRALYQHMGDVATLVSGPSGTGKELVARAIALGRYIPFDAATRRFAEDAGGSFYALNLSALSPTLVESELFGHRRGAFTGALQDRTGWLEVCPPLGTVFLDEIGEVDPAIQVKLLRVLQTRTFQRLGDTADRVFPGKLVAATNRDLGAAMRAGRFRADLYYRLCADLVLTPSLQAQIQDAPGELGTLLRFIAQRVAGEAEAEAVAEEAEGWITAHLGPDYPWPGNVRELEQCVRNVMIRGEYRPPDAAPARPADGLVEALLSGGLTAEALLRRYCTLVYARTGSYQETARRLGLDRRTVKERIDPALLAELRTPEPDEPRA